jgi:hypothetical protein
VYAGRFAWSARERARSVHRAVRGAYVKLTVSELFEGRDAVVKRQLLPGTTPGLDLSAGVDVEIKS